MKLLKTSLTIQETLISALIGSEAKLQGNVVKTKPDGYNLTKKLSKTLKVVN